MVIIEKQKTVSANICKGDYREAENGPESQKKHHRENGASGHKSGHRL